MKFLPDSAVVGFAKRLKNAGKPRNHKSVKVVSSEQVLATSYTPYNQDARSFEQLLAEAKRHAEKSGK